MSKNVAELKTDLAFLCDDIAERIQDGSVLFTRVKEAEQVARELGCDGLPVQRLEKGLVFKDVTGDQEITIVMDGDLRIPPLPSVKRAQGLLRGFSRALRQSSYK